MFLTFINSLIDFLANPALLFVSLTLSVILQLALLIILNRNFSNSKIVKRGTAFLTWAFIFFLIVDVLSMVKILHTVGLVPLDHSYLRLLKRTHWASNILFQLFLSLFAESLIAKNVKISRVFTLFRIIFGFCLASLFVLTLLLSPDINIAWGPILRFTGYFFSLAMGCFTIFTVLRATKKSPLPRILQYQVEIFVGVFMAPHLFMKAFTYNPFVDGRFFHTHIFHSLLIIWLTCAMCYCTFKLMGLRFLNTRDKITAPRKFDFVDLMKDVVVKLSSVANSAEFRHYTQQVFSKAFNLPDSSVQLILTKDTNYLVTDEQIDLLQTALTPHTPLTQLLERTKVITRDEIDFSAYYDQNPAYTQAADFLRKFNADVFIPIYDRNTFLGCIIVNQGARPTKFYSGREQNEMALFAGSLSSIITVVRNRNIDVVLAQNNSYAAEIYHRCREIGQYQESIRSFVRQAHGTNIGILYYKYGNFTFSNQTAHELVTCDPNSQRGHPLTVQLRKIAQNVEKYLTTQHTTVCLDGSEQRLAIDAFPSLEKQSTIVVVSHPGIADILKLQSDLLNDPGQWNYLLYLETTEVGHRVRGLLPGSSKTLLNFKIDLLRAALSQRAVLLNVRPEDRQPIVELLHTTHQREKLSTITLKEPERDLAVARELFGFAKVLGAPEETAPLLERLDKIGTIYIENVHLLSRETQAHLAEFLRYGAYTAIKGEQRTPSNVRIICATTESLPERVEQGLFLPELLDELRNHNLILPQPGKLERQEFGELVHEYMQQLLKNHALKKILVLSEREINVLYGEKCTTFFELKRRLSALISAKSVAKNLESESTKTVSTRVQPAKRISGQIETDERINQAILLGKHALQDRELMEYLWETFQNQSRIAALLGVNRSSVNRRFKQLQIGV